MPMGLGPYPEITLAEARRQAAINREHLAHGRNPRRERDNVSSVTFKNAALKTLAAQQLSGKIADNKTIHQWKHNTIGVLCAGILDQQIADITQDQIIDLMELRFEKSPVAATRELQRLKKIFKYAKVRKWLSGENPIGPESGIEEVLISPSREVVSHPALDFEDTPKFFKLLQAEQDQSSKALQFTMLTGVRTSETLKAKWDQIDFKNCIWTIPAANKKEKRSLRVPLNSCAMKLLEEQRSRTNQLYVFCGQKPNKPMSNMTMLQKAKRIASKHGFGRLTVHGFRSTITDWMAEFGVAGEETQEKVLGHKVKNKTRRSYRRMDALEERRIVLQKWEKFLLDD